jgi:hypothetical protein
MSDKGRGPDDHGQDQVEAQDAMRMAGMTCCWRAARSKSPPGVRAGRSWDLPRKGLDAGLEMLGRRLAEGIDLDGLFHVDFNAADLVDHGDEGVEVDHGVEVDVDAEQGLDRLHGQAGSAPGDAVDLADLVDGIELAVIKARDLDPQVAWYGKHPSRAFFRVDGQQDHRVRAGQAVAVGPIAVIQAHDEDRHPLVPVPGIGSRVTGRLDRQSGVEIQQRRAGSFGVDPHGQAEGISWSRSGGLSRTSCRPGSVRPADSRKASQGSRIGREACGSWFESACDYIQGLF